MDGTRERIPQVRFFNARRLGLLLALKSKGTLDDEAVEVMKENLHVSRILDESRGGWYPRALLWDCEEVETLPKAGRAFLLLLHQACSRRCIRLLVVRRPSPLRMELLELGQGGLEIHESRRKALHAVGLDGPRPIGRLLLEMGKIGRRSLELVLARQKCESNWRRLGELLIETGLVTPVDVHAALRLQRQARCLLA